MNEEGHKKVQEVIERLCNELMNSKTSGHRLTLVDAIVKLVSSLSNRPVMPRLDSGGVETKETKVTGMTEDGWLTYDYVDNETSHKEKALKHVKELLNKLDIDRIGRLTFDVDDRYEETIDIDISIELKRQQESE